MSNDILSLQKYENNRKINNNKLSPLEFLIQYKHFQFIVILL